MKTLRLPAGSGQRAIFCRIISHVRLCHRFSRSLQDRLSLFVPGRPSALPSLDARVNAGDIFCPPNGQRRVAYSLTDRQKSDD